MKRLSHQTLSAITKLTILTILLPVGAQVEFPFWLWFMLGVAWGISLSWLIVLIRLDIDKSQ